MIAFDIEKWFGLAGVGADENPRARWWWKCFRRMTSLVVLLLAVQWQLGVKGNLSVSGDVIFNWVIWGFFVIELFVLLTLVDNQLRLLRQNWMLLMVIISGIPLLLQYAPIVDFLRIVRPLLVVVLLIPWVDVCRESLSDNKLGTTLVSALIITLLSGIFLSGFDPGIASLWDGIWWAWVSVTTVGYGDVVPVSGLGRIFGALLILMGLVLFTVLIANFSAIFVGRGESKARKERLEIYNILKEIKAVKNSENEILEVLQDLQKRMKKLEKHEKPQKKL